MTCVKTYLYRCFDRDNQLIYVGVAENVERRRKEHAKDKFWWPDVTKVTVMAFETRAQALWAEWAVITTCNPIYNKSATVPAAPDTPPPFVEYGSTGSPRPGLWSRLIHRSAPVPVLPEPEFVEAAPDPERNYLAEQEFPEAEPAVPARPSRGAMMPPGMSLERQRAWRIKFGVPEPEPEPVPEPTAPQEPERPFGAERALQIIHNVLYRSGSGGTTAGVIAKVLSDMQWPISEAHMRQVMENGTMTGRYRRTIAGTYALPDGGSEPDGRIPAAVDS